MSKKTKIDWSIATAVFFIILLIVAFYSPNNVKDKPKKQDTSMAQNYSILEVRSYPTPPDKSGQEIFIHAPTAITFEQRGHTLIKAAYDLLESEGLYEVIIRLSALPSMKPNYIQAGRAKYTPHKKNTWGNDEKYVWEVEASKQEVELANGQLVEKGSLSPVDWLSSSVYLKQE